MQPLYRTVSLDDRAREYLGTIDVATTRENAEHALKAFYSFRRFHSPTPLAWKQMDVTVLSQFARWLSAHHFAEYSKRTYLSYVTEFLKFALDKEWLPEKFSFDRTVYRKKKSLKRTSYPIPRIDKRLPQVINYYDSLPLPELGGATPLERNQAEVRYLCLLRNRAVMQTLYSSAARVSEVSGLRRKHVQDGRAKEVVIKGKGDKERYIFLTSEAQAAIQTYCAAREDDREGLFISHGRHNGMPLSRQMLWKIVTDAASAVGVDCHPHDIRHYRASQMLKHGATLAAIQDILGHASINTTKDIYARMEKGDVRAIFDRTTLSAQEALREAEK